MTRGRLMMALASTLIFYAASGGPAMAIGRSFMTTRPMLGVIYAPINFLGHTLLGVTPPWRLYRIYLDAWKEFSD